MNQLTKAAKAAAAKYNETSLILRIAIGLVVGAASAQTFPRNKAHYTAIIRDCKKHTVVLYRKTAVFARWCAGKNQQKMFFVAK